MISLKTHNIIDYVIAAILVFTPFVFGFSEIDAARNIYLILGLGLAAYSLMTKYYYCVARVIPLGVHMTFDAAAGVVLIISPYLFDYRADITAMQNAIHFVLGAGAIGLVGITRTRTEAAKTEQEKLETSGQHYNHPRPV